MRDENLINTCLYLGSQEYKFAFGLTHLMLAF